MLAEWIRNCDAAKAARGDGERDHRIYFVLDNLRSVFNVGSIYRTAETAGAAQVVTCGITPHPPHEKLAKTGFSSIDYVATRHFSSTVEAVEQLEKEGIACYAMETTEVQLPTLRKDALSKPSRRAKLCALSAMGLGALCIPSRSKSYVHIC